MRLAGKRAIITGAGRGIGKATAVKFLKEGASVLALDIAPERVREAAFELASLGPIEPFPADVTKKSDCEAAVEACVDRFGGVDVLINNAGVAHFQPFLETTEEAWDHTMDVDLKGVFLMGQAAARRMVQQETGGAIVNMASTNGLAGERELSAYNAAKAGVLLLTKTMAIELAEHNIRVNAVCPGFILTDLAIESGASMEFVEEYTKKIPLGRYGRPEEVADLFAYLASDEASFITGEGVVIDGGQLSEE